MMKMNLQVFTAARQEILDDVIRVAAELHCNDLSMTEYRKHGKYSI